MSKAHFIILILPLLLGCKKEKIVKAYPNLCGNWRHIYYSQSENSLIYRSFDMRDGNGRVREYKYTGGKFEQLTGDVRRNWFIKDDYLYWRRTSSKKSAYKIDAYPIVSDTSYILGYDTIIAGKKIVRIDGAIYIKTD